jgi:hypothetical protein
MAFRIQVRRDTAANWEINNPVLLSAEMGYETDTGYLKFGDGQTDWNQLDYFTAIGETSVQVQYSGTPIGSYRILNFTGAGATLAPGVTNTVNITIPGAGPVGPTGQVGPTGPAGSLSVSSQSGTVVNAATGIQFIGSGVSVTNVGDTAIVNVLSTAGTDNLFNGVSRYRTFNSGGQIWILSSSTVKASLPWTRAGNTITITQAGHGHLAGEGIIIRNVNVDNEYCQILSVTGDTFSFDVSSSLGSSSGDEAAYSMAFSTSSENSAGSTITGPSGGDVQLLSMLITTGTRTGTTYTLTLPQSSKNGAGSNTTVNDIYFPIIRAQNLVAGTIVNANFTINSPYNQMVITGLPSSDSVGLRFNF